ncbi:NifU-like protein involved in Fe-S cluster formation [Rubellimicrobium thermophilum DSM 16684]|uniref:NifU-like protein involved in Fe-S cluster formation n=1 Tax=Rubellimicrobium thermophilum DSM 16684 TaxID=1123069 RepID=S9QXP3_9RHOB|nr:iron-sulfur cluster assembly scaffold protein [Rubellimicrobium thermophilum]EPX86106.1 NifU-like protein involved in Fe-S cluster formation [Rubellimicrobium thermophilum DSM 16684]
MSDRDLLHLYSQRLLALAADVPRIGRLAAPDGAARRRSPLCGSTVSVEVRMEGDRIADFAQEVRACALGQAAAAVVGGVAVGRTVEEVRQGRDGLRAMLKDGAPPPSAPWDGFEALLPARDHPNRHASVMLAIEATLEAVEAALGQPRAAKEG